jgi:nucleotide-binding universal stress UspA family protein
LFKNILVATDGSDLAARAVEQGILFAKEIGAKITALTVTEPFQLISVAPSQLEYTPIEYKKHAEAHAEKVLGTVAAAAKLAGVACATLHMEHEQIYQAIIDAARSPTPEQFVADSPLEEDGFELAVPPRRERLWAATQAAIAVWGLNL